MKKVMTIESTDKNIVLERFVFDRYISVICNGSIRLPIHITKKRSSQIRYNLNKIKESNVINYVPDIKKVLNILYPKYSKTIEKLLKNDNLIDKNYVKYKKKNL